MWYLINYNLITIKLITISAWAINYNLITIKLITISAWAINYNLITIKLIMISAWAIVEFPYTLSLHFKILLQRPQLSFLRWISRFMIFYETTF